MTAIGAWHASRLDRGASTTGNSWRRHPASPKDCSRRSASDGVARPPAHSTDDQRGDNDDMADIVRRGDCSLAPRTEWEPFHMMRWDPFRMIGLPLQVERDVWMPHFEVGENSDE